MGTDNSKDNTEVVCVRPTGDFLEGRAIQHQKSVYLFRVRFKVQVKFIVKIRVRVTFRVMFSVRVMIRVKFKCWIRLGL